MKIKIILINQKEFARTPGPPLNTKRYSHSCSTMRDSDKTFIVVAGGFNRDDDYLAKATGPISSTNCAKLGPSLCFAIGSRTGVPSLDR